MSVFKANGLIHPMAGTGKHAAAGRADVEAHVGAPGDIEAARGSGTLRWELNDTGYLAGVLVVLSALLLCVLVLVVVAGVRG